MPSFPQEYEYLAVESWMENDAVREALGVKVWSLTVGGGVAKPNVQAWWLHPSQQGWTGDWIRCRGEKGYTYANNIPSSVPYHHNVTSRGFRSLVFRWKHHPLPVDLYFHIHTHGCVQIHLMSNVLKKLITKKLASTPNQWRPRSVGHVCWDASVDKVPELLDCRWLAALVRRQPSCWVCTKTNVYLCFSIPQELAWAKCSLFPS